LLAQSASERQPVPVPLATQVPAPPTLLVLLQTWPLAQSASVLQPVPVPLLATQLRVLASQI